MDYKFKNGVLYVTPTKLMYLDYKRSKQSDRGAFYLLAFVLIFIGIPSLLAGLTFSNCIGVFIATFFGSIDLYEGWITEETVIAYTE